MKNPQLDSQIDSLMKVDAYQAFKCIYPFTLVCFEWFEPVKYWISPCLTSFKNILQFFEKAIDEIADWSDAVYNLLNI